MENKIIWKLSIHELYGFLKVRQRVFIGRANLLLLRHADGYDQKALHLLQKKKEKWLRIAEFSRKV